MSERVTPGLFGVAETLLLPLYARARESQRSDGVLHDPRAEQLVARLDYDFDRVTLRDVHQASRVMGTREFDRIVRDFLVAHPAGVVVHLGCGLDTRFDRVDNGSVTWFDLDLPEVIALRRSLGLADVPGDAVDRYHAFGGSALDDDWMGQVAGCGQRPVLIVAEGVLAFLAPDQVKGLVITLAQALPGAELTIDVFQPWAVRVGNRQMAVLGFQAPMRWGLRRPEDLLAWTPGLRLLQAWYYFDAPGARLHRYAWLRRVPGMRHFSGIFHYQLGTGPSPA